MKLAEIRNTFESTPYGWPRDAIDAALITLFTTGHIRATHKDVQLKQGPSGHLMGFFESVKAAVKVSR